MFDNNILIKGKHATYVKFLSEKTKLLGEGTSKNGAGVFKRFVDTLLIAPIFGVMKNMRADEDKSSDDRANILAEQIIKEKSNLEFVFKLVMLNDNSKGYNADEKINWIFRENGDFDLFMQYVRGGLEYLYDYFTDGATTKDDYYEKIISLIDETQLEFNGNYDEILSNLMK